MEFKEQLPVWKAEGIAPPETKQNEGWKVGDKPPADWFNYMWSRTYYSLDEVRAKMKWLADNSGKVETVNNVKPDSKKNIKLTGTNIAYEDGVIESIATKISKIDTEIDTVKQSGVKLNKRISDKLNSLKISASDSDSINENVTKFENIPNHGELTKTITTQNGKQIISPGYYEGGEVKAQFNNLVASNIKKGVNIGGVIGNYEQLMLNNIAGWEDKVTTRVIDATVGSNKVVIGELRNNEKKEFHFIGSVEVLSGSTTVKIGLSVGDSGNYTSDDNHKDDIIRAFTITLERRSDGYVSGYIGCNIINDVDDVRVREVRLGTSSAKNNNVAFYVSGASRLRMKGTVIESKLSI